MSERGFSTPMKLISWNVNGFRAVLQKGFEKFVKREQPDVICLQETKCGSDLVLPAWCSGFTTFWNVADRKGYSGTSIWTLSKPTSLTFGIGIQEHDREGRVITAEFPEFHLVNVYVPNSKRDLSRLAYRQQWD